jgi:hypothetical protein
MANVSTASAGFPRQITEAARVAISRDGHYLANKAAEGLLYYVVETKSGQITLTPDEFADKYDWKNDPSMVQLGETKKAN